MTPRAIPSALTTHTHTPLTLHIRASEMTYDMRFLVFPSLVSLVSSRWRAQLFVGSPLWINLIWHVSHGKKRKRTLCRWGQCLLFDSGWGACSSPCIKYHLLPGCLCGPLVARPFMCDVRNRCACVVVTLSNRYKEHQDRFLWKQTYIYFIFNIYALCYGVR